MDYTVEMAVRTARPLTQAVLSDVAAIGGAAQGHIGGGRLETTLTVEAPDVPAAAAAAIAQVTAVAPGEVICLEVMTTAEQDRRLSEPGTSHAVGSHR